MKNGIIIEATDFAGPGIEDVELAVSDGYSTKESLGYGLGTVNRFMDELKIISSPGEGTHVICSRKIRESRSSNCSMSPGYRCCFPSTSHDGYKRGCLHYYINRTIMYLQE